MNYSESDILQRDFYNQSTEKVARALLGKILVRNYKTCRLSGIIVETEAYLPLNDSAAHSFKGKTKRTEVLFGPSGRTYIHSIHQYNCMDISTEPDPIPGSVLIRALIPIDGLEQMFENRRTKVLKNICNGPGKLCQALGITKEFNGIDVTEEGSPICVYNTNLSDNLEISATPRVGISKATDLPLRFVLRYESQNK